jgi:hypothetical protein
MMTRTIARLFDSYDDAAEAVTELERLGVSHHNISLIANRGQGIHDETRSFGDRRADGEGAADHIADDAGKGAGIGAVLGGGAGLLASIGALAIPGIGPVVGAGWLAATLTGAAAGAVAGGATGGIVGALTEAGVDERDARTYSEGVGSGGTLVTVRVDENEAMQVEQVLDRFNGRTAQTWQGAGREIGSMDRIPPSTGI